MALVLSGSIDISGSMTATTILISSPGAAGMVSSSAQITELAPLMAYTASLKGAAIVSSSQQITNYYKFAETASANTFYGNQTFASSGGSGLRVYGGAGTHQWDMYLNGQNIRLSDNTAGDGAVRIDQRLDVGGHVTASGNLYIGAALQVQSDSAAITLKQTSTTAATGIYLERSSEQKGYYMYLGGSADSLTFQRNNAGTKADVMALSRDGDVTVSTGNLIMGTSGKGIDFSATSNGSGTMGSELLNDYEEGTWTPTLTCDTSPSGVAYNGRAGKYTKIGRVVRVEFVIGLTSKGTGTGDSFISGLPFTVANDMSAGEPACANISLCNGLSTSVYVLAGWADNGSTNIQLRKTTAASTTYPQSYLNTTDISDSLYIQGSVTYHV